MHFFSPNQKSPPPPSSSSCPPQTEHVMVGLSVILETCKDLSAKKSPHDQVMISTGRRMIKLPSSRCQITPIGGFLEYCFLCKQKILPGKDIFMYKGDTAFCSVECRCRQIFMDEEHSNFHAKNGCTISREYNSSLHAVKQP